MSSKTKCVYCRAVVTNKNSIESRCEKCIKNESKFGKPSKCLYCMLPAAFKKGKCVWCTYSERKCGPPLSCLTCKLRSAFIKPDDAERNKARPLCRLCRISCEKTAAKIKAKQEERKRKLEEINRPFENNSQVKTIRQQSSLLWSTNDLDSVTEQNYLVNHNLKNELVQLQYKMAEKEKHIAEKDKEITFLKSEIIRLERENRLKISEIQRENDNVQKRLQDRIKSMAKEIAVLTKEKLAAKQALSGGKVSLNPSNGGSPLFG